MTRSGEFVIATPEPTRGRRGRDRRRNRPADTEPRRGRSRDAFDVRRPSRAGRRRRATGSAPADGDRALVDLSRAPATTGARDRAAKAHASIRYIESSVEYEHVEAVRIKRPFVAADGTLGTMWLNVEDADVEAAPARSHDQTPRQCRLWTRVQAAGAARARRAAALRARHHGGRPGWTR